MMKSATILLAYTGSRDERAPLLNRYDSIEPASLPVRQPIRADAPAQCNGAAPQAHAEKAGALSVAGLRLVPSAPQPEDDDDDEGRPRRWRSPATRNQLLAAAACFLLFVGCGFPIGFSAVMLPQLRLNDSVFNANEDMESWIASVHSAATPLGALCSSYLSERVGRRSTLQLTALPFLLGWLLLAFANSFGVVIAGRALCGFAVGVSASPCQVFLGEISEVDIRGLLAGVPMLSYSVGILLVYALGACLDWHVVAGMGPVLPLLALAALCFIPRSPVWLVRHGRCEDARKALAWFRGSTFPTNKVNRELGELIERADKDDERRRDARKKGGGCCSVFRHRTVWKPFVIVNLLNILQIVSGTFIVIFYGVDIVQSASSASSAGSGIEGETFAVVLAAVRMLSCVVGCCLLVWWTRRSMAIVSGVLTAIAAVALGAVLLVKEQRPTGQLAPASEQLVIAALLLLYVTANTAGFFMLPLIAIGEMLPARVRGVAGGYTFFVFNLLLFIVTKLFPYLSEAMGMSGVFISFGLASVIGTILVYLLMPETKGRTLNEVEDYFKARNYLWITRHRYQYIEPTTAQPMA